AAPISGVGDDESEIVDADWFERILAEDRQRLRFAIAEAVQTTGRVHTRFRFDSPDREEVRWIEMWARIIEEPSLITVGLQGEPEKIVRIVGVAGDVTDQQQAEEQTEALLEAEMAARRSAERARERAVLLSQASEMFSQTLASDAVIDSVAQFAVPSF